MAGSYSIRLNGLVTDQPVTFAAGDSVSFRASKMLDLNVEQATIVFKDLSTMNLALSGLGNVGPPIQNGTTPTQDIDVQILRDGAIWWRGIAWLRHRYIAEPSQTSRQYALDCVSNKKYLDREAFRYTGNATEGGSGTYFDVIYGGANTSTTVFTSNGSTLCSSVLNDILNCQKGASGDPTAGGALTLGTVGPNNGHTLTPHVCLYFIRSYALSALAQLIDGSLWEARFNENNTVDFENQVGSLTSVKTFNEGENILDIPEDFGIDNTTSDVVVCGAGSANPNPLNQTIVDDGLSEEIDNSPPGGPRYTKFFNLSNIFDTTLLKTYASVLSTDLQYSLYSFAIPVVDHLRGVNWHLGDVVELNSPTLGYSDYPMRILQEQRSWDYENGEQITLSLTPNIHMASVANIRLRALEYLLNSQTCNAQLFQNTVQTTPQGYPTTASLSNSINGITTATAPVWIAIGLSGVNNNAAICYVTGTFGGVYTSSLVEIVDVTNSNYVLYSNSSPVSGTQYSVTPSYDILDHVLAFIASCSGASGAHLTAQVNGETVTNQTLPT